MFSSLKRKLLLNLKNIPGWSTNRKIVAFISDDWGDQRIHSENDYKQLLKKGYPVDKTAHFKTETLASFEDLNKLYEVLSSVKDSNGRSAVISPFVIMANPDFEKIQDSGFKDYYYKLFTDTLRERENGEITINAWKTGINENLFLPELHGREHINVPLWMRKLQNRDPEYLTCFRFNFAHYTSSTMRQPIVASYNFQNDEDRKWMENSLVDGIDQFETIFGKKPTVFNPPNGIFHSKLYTALISKGVSNIDAAHYRMEPAGNGGIMKKRCVFGEVSPEGMVHSISNCAFEPIKSKQSVVEDTLKQIEAAFRWNKPALINTHRVNYVKGRGGSHRDDSLKSLSTLLKKIVNKWPNVEFMGMGEFSEFMNRTIERKGITDHSKL